MVDRFRSWKPTRNVPLGLFGNRVTAPGRPERLISFCCSHDPKGLRHQTTTCPNSPAPRPSGFSGRRRERRQGRCLPARAAIHYCTCAWEIGSHSNLRPARRPSVSIRAAAGAVQSFGLVELGRVRALSAAGQRGGTGSVVTVGAPAGCRQPLVRQRRHRHRDERPHGSASRTGHPYWPARCDRCCRRNTPYRPFHVGRFDSIDISFADIDRGVRASHRIGTYP